MFDLVFVVISLFEKLFFVVQRGKHIPSEKQFLQNLGCVPFSAGNVSHFFSIIIWFSKKAFFLQEAVKSPFLTKSVKKSYQYRASVIFNNMDV